MEKKKLFKSIAMLTAVLLGSSAATFVVQKEIRDNVAIHGRAGQDNIQFAFFQITSSLFELRQALDDYEAAPSQAGLDRIYLQFSVVYSNLGTLNTPAYDLIWKPEKYGKNLTINLPKSNLTPLQKFKMLEAKMKSFDALTSDDETVTAEQAHMLEHDLLPELTKLSQALSIEASMIMNVYVSDRAHELSDAGDKSIYLLLTQLLLVLILTVFLIRRLKKSLDMGEFLKQTNMELLDTQEKLKASNKAKDVFISSMTHELRTPLNSILGFTQILKSEPEKLDAEQLNFIDHIHTSGQHLTDLIADILDFTKIEGGYLEVTMEYYGLQDLVHHILRSLIPQAQKQKITINIDIDPTIDVWADRKRLKQVLINLISNAIKYNKFGGDIYISSEVINDEFIIHIRDTGIGIPEEYQSKVFTPFNRLGHENSTIEGTGIGLSISKKLVENMDGFISFSSEKNIGTTFSLHMKGRLVERSLILEEKETINVSKHIEQSELEINNTHLPLTLIIGDSDHVLRHQMEQLNYPYVDIHTEEEYELIVFEDNIGFIMLDVDNKPEALDWLHKSLHNSQWKEVPSLAVSAHLDENIMTKAIELGVVDFLNKPLNEDYFASIFKSNVKDNT